MSFQLYTLNDPDKFNIAIFVSIFAHHLCCIHMLQYPLHTQILMLILLRIANRRKSLNGILWALAKQVQNLMIQPTITWTFYTRNASKLWPHREHKTFYIRWKELICYDQNNIWTLLWLSFLQYICKMFTFIKPQAFFSRNVSM